MNAAAVERILAAAFRVLLAAQCTDADFLIGYIAAAFRVEGFTN